MRVAEAFRRQKELAEALSPNETPDYSHNYGVVIDAVVGPGLSANVLPGFGMKPLQVDSVAEQHQLAVRHAQAGQHLKILRVLDKLSSRAQRGRPFEAVDHGLPHNRILRTGIEAMHGIDHSAHAGRTGSHPTIEAWLGVVGVDDVGLEPSEKLPKLAQGHEVLPNRNGPGGVAEGLVVDAPRF